MAKIYHKFLLMFVVTIFVVINCDAQSPVYRKLSGFYNGRQYAEARAFVDSLIKANGSYYFSAIEQSHIGVFRFETGDFKGAIKDFDEVIGFVDTTKTNWGWTLAEAEHRKPAAHLALGQEREAAHCYEYFTRRYQSTYSSWQGLVLYMNNGQKAKYRQFLPITLSCYRFAMEADSATRRRSWLALDYAELLLVDGKPLEALGVLSNSKLKLSDDRNIASKHALIAVAKYLINPKDQLQIRTELKALIQATGTVKGLGFAFLEPWLKHILKDTLMQHYIGLLLQVAKDGGY